jgi:putative glutamine amidotransferase
MSVRIGVTVSNGIHGDRRSDVVQTSYVDAVVDAGGLPLLLPILDPLLAPAVLASVDALVLTGGGDVDPACYGHLRHEAVYGVDPRRDEWELALVRGALERDVPVLGICRGAQVLNVARGGTLVQHLPDASDQPHRAADRSGEVVHVVDIAPASTLGAITRVSALGANTLHHQAVALLGVGLRPVAWADDGTIEGIELTDGRPVVGVQWHPELLTGFATHRALFRWIVEQGETRGTTDAEDDRAVA